MQCDFCSAPEPLLMFANPKIECARLGLEYRPGHFAACDVCAGLIEAGLIERLAERAVNCHDFGDDVPNRRALAVIHEELVRVYGHISRHREPIESENDYARRMVG